MYGMNNQAAQPAPLEQDHHAQNEPEAENGHSKMSVQEDIAAADIQNPSDALEFLANVADRAEGRMLPPIRGTLFATSPQQPTKHSVRMQTPESVRQHSAGSLINFAPLQRGQINIEMMHELVNRYVANYHPFFPLANPEALDVRQLPMTAAQEPHLLAAICTIASKDDRSWWNVHEACSAHMQELIASLVYGGGGSVEAVEALLILAEWVPRRPQTTPSIGKGEEDHQAWMFVGTAVRLGYLLGLDRTGFRNENDPQSQDLNRKRLAWSAVYMSDRHVSVRIGKAFWSRGPGPMTGLSAHDFPSLRARGNRSDNYASIWEANMELTQLFSNAHDVLYSSKNRSAQLNSGGEYVKYIDDFRTATRAWHNTWGMLTCSPPLKASLILSYEYLRLYINAFAYQATMNRMVVQANDYVGGPSTRRTSVAAPFTDFVAATPDARFIYDSVDAAKSLLNTFNSFVDPVITFRYMPLRYYLYVIYSACFLYKARSTGVLGGDRSSVKRMITDTIERLEKASANVNDVGDRYSKLIRLLWRKPPSKEGPRPSISHILDQGNSASGGLEQQHLEQQGYDFNQQAPPLSSINTFSWLDLQGVENFATNNNSISNPGSSSMEGMDVYDDGPAVDGIFAPFNPAYMTAHQPMAWNGVSPPGIIF